LPLLVHLMPVKQGIGGFDRAREAKVRQRVLMAVAVPSCSTQM
jgi:hypothetical protein